MKNKLVPVLIIAIAATFSSCKKKDNTSPATANLMFVNACAAGATTVNLDGKVSGTTIVGASNIGFLKNSGYKSVAAGTSDISFFVTGLNQLTHASESMVAGSYYSVFAGGSITQPVLVFSADDRTAPATGMAKVRFVNLCPDNLTTSCYIGTVKVDSNVAYQTVTPFIQVAAGTIKVGMFDQTTLTNSAIINSQVLAAGTIYTFIFTGTSTGSGSSVLTLTPITN